MIDQQCPSKMNTSTAPLRRPRRQNHVADLCTAMKHYRQTFPSLRTCSRARSQASPYISDFAAQICAAADLTIGALGDVSCRSAQGTPLDLEPRTSADIALTSEKTRIQIINPSPGAMYSGISNAMVTISRVEGFSTLWRGLSSVVMGAGGFARLRDRWAMALTML